MVLYQNPQFESDHKTLVFFFSYSSVLTYLVYI